MKKKKIFALMAAALSLAACSTNDIADIAMGDADNVVNVASVTRSGEGASTTSATPMTASFHLINITQATKHNVNFEADFTHNGTEYTPTDGKKVVWYNVKDADGNETPNEFKAFSPINDGTNNASLETFNLPTNQSTASLLQSADWMTAEPEAIKKSAAQSDGGLKLEFSHKNAKLHFKVILKDDLASSNVTLSNIKVVDVITPYYNSTDNSKIIEAIVEADKDYSNVNLIEVTIDGDTYAVPIPQNPIIIPEEGTLYNFEEGKQYNFDLSIGHDQATISSVLVKDWDDGDIELNGDDDALLEGYSMSVDPETGTRTFTISNYAAFKAWTQTNDVENTNITLDGNITVPEGETLPYINSFNGIFDGNGHTITTTLYSVNESGEYGLLVGTNNGTIKNVKVNISNGTNPLNGIANKNSGTIEYCTIEGNVTTDFGAYGICVINCGKIIACTNNADFSGCNASNGISGHYKDNSKSIIIGCINNGNTKDTGITNQVGYDNENVSENGSSCTGTMISCVNTGTISEGGNALYNKFVTGSTMKNCYWTSGNQSDYETNKASGSAGGQVTNGWTTEIINNLNTAQDGDNKSIQDYGYEFKVEDNKLIIVPYTSSSSSSAARR